MSFPNSKVIPEEEGLRERLNDRRRWTDKQTSMDRDGQNMQERLSPRVASAWEYSDIDGHIEKKREQHRKSRQAHGFQNG
jgi:hypothetical protein